MSDNNRPSHRVETITLGVVINAFASVLSLLKGAFIVSIYLLTELSLDAADYAMLTNPEFFNSHDDDNPDQSHLCTGMTPDDLALHIATQNRLRSSSIRRAMCYVVIRGKTPGIYQTPCVYLFR